MARCRALSHRDKCPLAVHPSPDNQRLWCSGPHRTAQPATTRESCPDAHYRNPRPRSGCVCADRSEEHTSELQSLMRISYAVFCLNKKKYIKTTISPINYYTNY